MTLKLHTKTVVSAILHDPSFKVNGVYNEWTGISVTTPTKGLWYNSGVLITNTSQAHFHLGVISHSFLQKLWIWCW